MALYNPKVVISAAPGITDYLYLVLYEASNPTVPVANSGQIAPPHVASLQIPFYNLQPVIHLATLFRTNGVDVVGTEIANFQLDPQYPGVEIHTPWFIKADETSGFDSGGHVFTDPTNELAGWDYTVDIRQTFGRLDEGRGEISKSTKLIPSTKKTMGGGWSPIEVFIELDDTKEKRIVNKSKIRGSGENDKRYR